MPTPPPNPEPVPLIWPVAITSHVHDVDDAHSLNAYAAWSEAVISQYFLALGFPEGQTNRVATAITAGQHTVS